MFAEVPQQRDGAHSQVTPAAEPSKHVRRRAEGQRMVFSLAIVIVTLRTVGIYPACSITHRRLRTNAVR